MRLIIVLISAVFLFTQCSTGNDSSQEDGFTAGPNAETYDLKGKVVSVDKSNKKASIAHEEIPGFMEAMTMDFEFKEDWVWDVLEPGVEVQADLVVDNEKGRYWLERPRIVASSVPDKELPTREDVGSVGKKVIGFELTDQDGKAVKPSDFEGKAWAITFIYTECPLPEFCIVMSKNFSDAANQLAQDEELKDKVRLLTISFDPERDTPEKLKSYGLGYLGKDSKASDFENWKLAVGKDAEVRKIADFFGLRYEVDEKDKTQFNHSLRTIVIAPDGTVRKVFSGNDWTPADLLRELRASLP